MGNVEDRGDDAVDLVSASTLFNLDFAVHVEVRFSLMFCMLRYALLSDVLYSQPAMCLHGLCFKFCDDLLTCNDLL